MTINNGNNKSKNHRNWSSSKSFLTSFAPSPSPSPASQRSLAKIEQPVIFQQSRFWSQAIIWSLISVSTGAIIWANVAQFEEAVSAQGKLEPSSTVKEIQLPIGGVVKEIYVEDGQHIKAGEKLLSLDPTTTNAQLDSLNKIHLSLVQENQFYQAQIQGDTAVNVISVKISSLMLDLTKSRTALVAENQIYRAQLNGTAFTSSLTREQRERLLSTQAELNARVMAARMEINQLSHQLNQTDIKLASTQDTLAMNIGILDKLTLLMKDGAISQIQYIKQQEEVRNARSEIDQLSQERFRLQSAISQAQAKLQNTVAVSRKDWLTQIAENNKKIAEIDSQLTKTILENNKKLADIDGQLSQIKMNLKYQELIAPVDGTIFELKAHSPGFVVTSSEPILKVVPNDTLIAKVYITNKDIGFVKEGMTVDVRIDSFPLSEFGDIKGKLVWIGSDSLPPDQIYPFYRFPAKVQLNSQQLNVSGRNIMLQSGMGVSTNIKIRERTVMSIFTDMFTSSVESLKTVR
ncbi:hemolysin D [Nostoc minutum NIES-26]|uniref:Hemolysin D n=1 Tax=Nostoc minutum NIES-26 TaxID=1844469 RepID=A0A367R2E1_9NOSO|nr:hemolysin D [Nostoc minutum NIES-26]